MNDRNVDLLIVRRFGSIADERLDFEFLFDESDESFVVAAGARHQWVRRRRIELADLANEPWVLPPPESVIGSIALDGGKRHFRLESRCVVPARSFAHCLS
jgi:DNA-binding transcriptional LysR family regulator